MNAKSILRGTFRAGITMKGIDGLLEALGGVLLWFIKPSAMSATLQVLCQHELSRDPHDFVAAHLLHMSERLAHSDPLFASIYLFSHGAVKVLLAIVLWLDELWAYPVAIGIFGAFSVYQIYRYTHTRAITLLVLTVFDVAVVWLTWQEYRVQKSIRKGQSGRANPPAS
jgi:uncharacterized membrane protein